MQALEEQFKKQVESGSVELPVLPAVSTEVMALTRGEDADASQLAQLIQNDQSLSGHIMRLANSAAYNTGGKIQTLQQAITRLGMREIGQMALTVSVGQSVFTADSATEQVVEYLWRHALASATWAREIARLSRSNTEVAFLCGLLHQIGKPVAVNLLVKMLEDEAESLRVNQELLSIIDKYDRVIGVSLARRWEFPDAVVEAIHYIDEYFAAPSARQEVMIVNAARWLATQTLEAGEAADILAAMADQAVFTELNFYQDDLESLVEKVPVVQELLDSITL